MLKLIMSFFSGNVGAYNTHANELSYSQINTQAEALQVLRDAAWEKANKYRWDPTVGQIHADYLKSLNDLLGDCAS